ncbi:hypothetical protein HKK52_27640 [Pseudomonas sp. ADAK2]|uniref:Ig-like domain-containing protein n=1 Tax=unclassified Pseudomonas TaxID=196821 RepID=UPI0014640CE7|nr:MULTISPECIES: Ig-like domain-containing protein [unclassified Pseudomonas]QJI44573.1 hypothetical protein HKK53_27640 [Pseudomonas sp. ADAK7]QJI50874.1 hypothetical protein HKK52_27640 [Pseudomonas sp. ADAK2]
MRDPAVQANQNLVVNGDFSHAIDHWNKHPSNTREVSLAEEFYQGEMTRFLRVGNGASVSQVIAVPMAARTDVWYGLSFLCEVRYSGTGRVLIEMVDHPENNQDIPLLLGQARNEEEDRARLLSGQPLEFLPIEYEVRLTLPLQSNDRIRVRVFSPTGGTGDVMTCITRIHLALHLPRMELQTLKLDEELLPAAGVLPLCLGASASSRHRLECVPMPGHPWLGTQAALTLENNPRGAILAQPDWGVDHPLEAPWSLDCPLLDDPSPRLLTMQLVNQYTAEPYPIEVSLGHHRLVFRDVLEAAYYPVMEHGQTALLGVQVASFYTGQTLDALTVNWTVAGQGVRGASLTDEDGWAYFKYVPTTAGDFAIEATVASLYYASGIVSTTLAVRVLATDPWKTLLSVVEGIEKRWEDTNGYPNRGSGYPLQVRLTADHLLSGSEMQLRWSGDSAEQLGVVVSPALESPVPVNGRDLTWTLTSEDRLDGRFELSLVCSKLLLPSPKKTMSLARNLVRIGEVREANRFPVVDENENVLLRIQVVHVLVSGDGDPVFNALVDWITPEGPLPTVVTGAGGWASLLYTPKSAGNWVVTARVRAHEEAVAVERNFDVRALASSPWKSEVRILLDNVEVDRLVLGVLCWRGRAHTLKVEPLPGSTLIGQPVTLNWRGTPPAIGLEASDIGTPRNLTAAGLEWTFTSALGTSLSSLFELKLSSPRLSLDRELFGRLVAPDLAQEASLTLDQVSVVPGDQALYPCLGAVHRFSLLPNALSPLVGLSTTLSWTGALPEQLGASIDPPLAQSQVIDDGGARWSLDFTASPAPGTFALALKLPQLGLDSAATSMILAHNKVRIEAWREAAVDPVVGQEPAWAWIQVFSHFTGLAVEQVPVTWLAGEQSAETKTDAKGWTGFGLVPTAVRQQVVEAVLVSPYDGYEDKRSMMVTVLTSDPWEGVTISFDGQPPQPWGSKTCFPRRKGNHLIEIMAADNSPLFDQDLVLGLTGTGPAELGIRFDPINALGTARWFSSSGLRYGFVVGDVKDGAFALRLAASRLARLSLANAMSLGSGVQVVKFKVDNHVTQTLDWGQTLFEQVTVVSSVSGKSMAGLPVTWRNSDLGTVISVTDYYGVAKISFIPTQPGPAQLTATVGDTLYSESITSGFTLNEPRKIVELINVGGTEHDSARVRVKVASSRTGEPLQDVKVMWELNGSRLPFGETDADGFAWLDFVTAAGEESVVVAMVEGGEAGWDMALLGLNLTTMPVIESLICDRTQSFTGYRVTARALVLESDSTNPLPGIEINWRFAGQALPVSTSDVSGIARITFETRDVGEFDLVASLASGLPGTQTQRISVESLPAVLLRGIYAVPAIVQVGRPSDVKIQVVGLTAPVAGILVRWSVDGSEREQTYSNDQGWAPFRFVSSVAGTFAIAAAVENPVGTVSMSMTVRVINS